MALQWFIDFHGSMTFHGILLSQDFHGLLTFYDWRTVLASRHLLLNGFSWLLGFLVWMGFYG